MKTMEKTGEEFNKLVRIIAALRSRKGCPWDREQDEKTIINFFLEEVYEAVEASFLNDTASLSEELGDVLMEIVFLAQIYREKKKFSVLDVLKGINRKLIRRHPHVFGRRGRISKEEVVEEWMLKKKKEKERESVFDEFPESTPSLFAAFQIGEKVSRYGFDWESPLDALCKVKEEIFELEKAMETQNEREISSEIGDVFFSLANISRLLGINPEIALRQANAKFIKRFRFIEKKLKERNRKLGKVSLKELDEIWEESKKIVSSKQ